MRAIWNKYYSESHGIVFVVDSANETRFEEAKHTLRALFGGFFSPASLFGCVLTVVVLVFVDAMLDNTELSGVPLLVLANKIDLEVVLPARIVCVGQLSDSCLLLNQNAHAVQEIRDILDVETHAGTVNSYPICALTRSVFPRCLQCEPTIWKLT